MGINGERSNGDIYDQNKQGEEERENKKRWKKYTVCLSSFMASMAGGALLVYWQIKYHPKNRELWMVPFGLVLFTTPILVCFISLASDACCPTNSEHHHLRLQQLSLSISTNQNNNSNIHNHVP